MINRPSKYQPRINTLWLLLLRKAISIATSTLENPIFQSKESNRRNLPVGRDSFDEHHSIPMKKKISEMTWIIELLFSLPGLTNTTKSNPHTDISPEHLIGEENGLIHRQRLTSVDRRCSTIFFLLLHCVLTFEPTIYSMQVCTRMYREKKERKKKLNISQEKCERERENVCLFLSIKYWT